jgi:hypothetical protein
MSGLCGVVPCSSFTFSSTSRAVTACVASGFPHCTTKSMITRQSITFA